MQCRTLRQLASGQQHIQSSWVACSTRGFAAREGASTEEKYGKETDDNMAPPKGAQEKEGHDLDKKADTEVRMILCQWTQMQLQMHVCIFHSC